MNFFNKGLQRLSCLIYFFLCLGIYLEGYASSLKARLDVNGYYDHGQVILDIQVPSSWKLYGPSQPQDTLIYPPQILWENGQNHGDIKVIWPSPNPLITGDERAHVYTGYLKVPVIPSPSDSASPVILKGKLKGLLCSTVCVPFETPLELTLPPQQTSNLSLVNMIGFAFLGGIILNFMPCVLPVLGLKLLAFSQSPTSLRNVRKNLWITVAGIYLSFLLFAFTAISFRLAGEAVGWGLHFQSPLFLSLMVVVLILFISNLWGWFYFNPPKYLSFLLQSKEDQNYGAAFLSGVLAVFLATPCSAPFVGTAVGFALSQGVTDILVIFSALAGGFAFPYMVAGFIPFHHWPLPKPGAWMLNFQRFLGFLLLLTLGWLLFLLKNHQTFQQFLVLLGVGAVIFGGLFLKHKGYAVGKIIALSGIVTIMAQPLVKRSVDSFEVIEDKFIPWKPFNPDLIPQLVQQGETVFVDITASWCLTCQLNKQLLLKNQSVLDILNKKMVIMQADWTVPNPSILAFLKKHQRAGIPFNIVFGPHAPRGIILPEILTPQTLLEVYHKAK